MQYPCFGTFRGSCHDGAYVLAPVVRPLWPAPIASGNIFLQRPSGRQTLSPLYQPPPPYKYKKAAVPSLVQLGLRCWPRVNSSRWYKNDGFRTEMYITVQIGRASCRANVCQYG